MPALLLLVLLVAAAPARAQLDAARAAYDSADFDAALEALDRVAREPGQLDRDALIAYLELRAMVAFATDDGFRMREALVQLASIDPTHAFSSSVPPPMLEVFAEAGRDRTPISLLSEAVPEPGVLHLAAAVRGDVGRLVSSVRLRVRLLDEPGFRLVEGDAIDVTRPEGGTLEYYAEAVGLGGAVLARAGSVDDPRRASFPPLHAPEDHTGRDWGIALGIGGALALAAGIAIGVLVGTSSGVTQIDARIDW